MNEKAITKVPVPGGSGRVPTGAMEFLEDWPGLFIRGDDAITLLGEIHDLQLKMQAFGYRHYFPMKLAKIAKIIEQDVIVHDPDSASDD